MNTEPVVHYLEPGKSFFEVRISARDGGAAVRDSSCICADTFAQAEQFALEEYGHLENLCITAISKQPYQAVFTGGGPDTSFFSVKARIVIDIMRSGKEKTVTKRYLVQHDSIPGARSCINSHEGEDVVVSVVQTPVTGFFDI